MKSLLNLSDTAVRALHELYLFCTEYWRLDLEEKPHRAMCNIIQKGEEDPDDKPYSMTVVPRGCYKTSIARAAALWKQLRQIYLFNNPYRRVMLASAVLAHSEAGLRVIEGQLRTNRHLIEDYGELFLESNGHGTPSSRHPDGLILAPRIHAGELASIAEPSFWVGSIRRISTGFHADDALIDDLNNKENTATDFQRDKTNTYWKLLFPILGKKSEGKRPGTIHLNATPWHDADVRGTILREERERLAANHNYKSKWLVLHEPAVNEAGELFWPSHLGEDALDELRESMGAAEFSANYLCDPVGENAFVKEDEIVFRPRKSFPAMSELKNLRLLVDPSQHTKAKALGCYCAMVVAGFDRFSNLYVLDAKGSRSWDTGEIISALFDFEEEYNSIDIMIEDKHMAHFDHSLHLEESVRNRRLRVRYIPAEGETKYQKWQKLQPRFQGKRVFFAEEIDPKIKAEIKEELVRGVAARFKDFLDALAMSVYGVRPRVDRTPKRNQPQAVEAGKPPPPTFANIVPGIEKYYPKTR